MKDSSSQPLAAWLLVAAFLGVLFGLLLKDVALWFTFASSLYLNALVLVVFPLILSSVLVGLVNLGDYRKLGPVGLKTIGLFLASSGIAVTLGLVLAVIIGPGRDVPSLAGAPLSSSLIPESLSSISGFLSTLIPANLIASTSGGQYLGLAITAVIIGAVLSTMATKVRGVVTIVRGFHDIMERLVALLLKAAPVGLFFVMATAIAANRDALGDTGYALLKLSTVVLIGLVIHLLVILPVFLIVFARRNPVEYYKNLWPAMVTGLVTGSSVATFSVTYDNVVTRNEVDSRAASFVLPLSLSLNMNGSALFLGAASIFVLQIFGLPITIWVILKIFVAALVVSMGVSGIPSGALFGLATIGAFGGFSTEALAAFASLVTIDWLLDRFRTVVNVAGDGVAAAVIGEVFEFKTVGRKVLSAGSRRSDPRPPRRGGRGDGPDKDKGRSDGKPDRKPRERRERPTRPDRPDRSADRRPQSGGRDDSRKKGPVDGPDKSPRGGDDDSRARRDDRPDRTDRPDRRDRRQPGRSDVPDRGRRDRQSDRRDSSRQRSDERPDRPDRRDQRPPQPDRPVRIDNAPDAEVKPADIKAEVEAGAAAAALSPETIKRELSQVRAQLQDTEPETQPEPTQASRQPKPKPEPREEMKRPEPKPEPREETKRPEPKPEPTAQVDRPAEPAPAREEARPERKPEPRPEPKAQDKPDEKTDDQAEERKISYGRGLHKKGKTKGGSDTATPGPVESDSAESERTPSPADSYSNEEISFGRGKRKKG